ncbi:MAG: hypothetical protein J7K54_04715 [Candidatus Aenigmarchaeota archaeon]|nr:hypothetical protein [Candidatus Aenigmarchaeota archaeon]
MAVFKLTIDNNFLALLSVIMILVSTINLFAAENIKQVQTPAAGNAPTAEGIIQLCTATSPVISGASYHEVQQDFNYVYDFNATGEGTGSVTFGDNTTLFDITTDTGIVDFTPTNDNVGVHSVLISATESICGLSKGNATIFNITNRNDEPNITAIWIYNQTSGSVDKYTLQTQPNPPHLKYLNGQIDIWEDYPYILSVIADDPDMHLPPPYTESLTYFDIPPELFQMNDTTGNATFMPVQSEVGTHNFKFYADDGDITVQTDWISIVVHNRNDPPVLENKTNLTVVTLQTGMWFDFDMNATDEDGDTLTYGADFVDCEQPNREPAEKNCTIFYPDASTGIIHYRGLLPDVGNYTVNYTVYDGNGGLDYQLGNFTVILGVNQPPNITEWNPYEENVTMYEGFVQPFNITVIDPETGTNTVSTKWYANGNLVATDVYAYNFSASYESSGVYNITVIADDGYVGNPLTDSHNWTLIVLERKPPSPPGGHGGGWSIPVCIENWRCTAWSDCSSEGIQLRTCIDLAECPKPLHEPIQKRNCTYTPNPTCYDGMLNCHDGNCEIMTDCGGPCQPCPTCSDGIQNCHVNGDCEEGIDCGGPCRPCLTLPEVPVCGNQKCEAGELFGCAEDCTDFWLNIMVFSLVIILLIVASILLYIYRKETVLLYVYRRVRGGGEE